MIQVYELTCKNHTGARYLTKGFGRSLHFVTADEALVRSWFANERPNMTVSDELVATMRDCPSPSMECDCPASDLVEVPSKVHQWGQLIPEGYGHYDWVGSCGAHPDERGVLCGVYKSDDPEALNLIVHNNDCEVGLESYFAEGA